MSSAPDEHSGECPNYETFQDRLNRQQIEITRLQTELAEARKDKERLDWLFNSKPRITITIYGHASVLINGNDFKAETGRGAIDAAMKATPQ